jgi:hypothetical protein
MPCGRPRDQPPDLAPASRPQRHVAGHPPRGAAGRLRLERYRNGERISTGFVESTVNQVISKRFCKKQQMAWTPRGAHLLLQSRTRVLNGD